MNEHKEKQLWASARTYAPAKVPVDFVERVRRGINRGEPDRAPVSLLEQLSISFPPLAAAALLMIVAVVAFDLFTGDDLTSQLAQASDQWLLPLNWL
jgi:hypothetical protein